MSLIEDWARRKLRCWGESCLVSTIVRSSRDTEQEEFVLIFFPFVHHLLALRQQLCFKHIWHWNVFRETIYCIITRFGISVRVWRATLQGYVEQGQNKIVWHTSNAANESVTRTDYDIRASASLVFENQCVSQIGKHEATSSENHNVLLRGQTITLANSRVPQPRAGNGHSKTTAILCQLLFVSYTFTSNIRDVPSK